MIVVEDLFDVDKNETSTLAEKSKKLVDVISQGLVETLKGELYECRNIVNNQRRRIKDLEQEKKEFLENQLAAKHDGVYEMNELLEHLRKSVQYQKSGINGEVTDLDTVNRDFNCANKLMSVIKDGLDISYKKVANKSSEIVDLKDIIKEQQEKVKKDVICVESMTEENDFLKKKIEQSEKQHRLTIDELNMVQNQLKTIDHERLSLFEENVELKSGKVNFQDYCSNISEENEKLLKKIKLVQEDRNNTFNELHEQILKTNQYSTECNEVDIKCENLEHAIAKLRREYQDQTREINILTRENEELKTSLQDSEQRRIKMKRNMKSIETGNKDLEDQIFQLTTNNQKIKHDQMKTKHNEEEQEEHNITLIKKLENLSNEKTEIEEKLKEVEKKEKDLEEKNKNFKHNEVLATKRKTLLVSYEKLIIKLLHQRKELLAACNIDHGSHTFKVSTSQSIEYKELSEIEISVKITGDEADSSFAALSTEYRTIEKGRKRYLNFFRELSSCIRNIEEKDSCYSTEGDFTEPASFLPGRDVSEGKRGLSALRSNSIEDSLTNEENLSNLISAVKKCIQCGGNNNREVVEMSRKLKRANKRVRQLQVKVKNRRSLEHNMKNKISLLKKEIKALKEFHRSFHEKMNTPPQNTPPRNIYTQDSMPKIKLIISDLREGKEELKKIKVLLNNPESTGIPVKTIGKGLDNVKQRVTRVTEELSSYVSNCGGGQQKEEECTVGQSNDLDKRFETLQKHRQYMLDHMIFTNKRLEVLLNCLKGKTDMNTEYKTNSDDNNNEINSDTSEKFSRRLLKRVRDSFKSDQDVMRKAVSILELTKVISVVELTEPSETKEINEEHEEMIVVVKSMNENMDSVLREARSHITDAKIKLDTTPVTSLEESNIAIVSSSETLSEERNYNFINDSEFLKKESELKLSLENARKKVEDLSIFLEKREAELKERDKIIAKLNVEFEELKKRTKGKNNVDITTRDRIIKEYSYAVIKLEKENEFLQMVVKEVREELLKFHKTYRKEEETQKHLQEFVEELQVCKSSLEQSLDKMAYELNIVKQDRDHLMKTIHQMGTNYHSYREPWFDEPVMTNGMVYGYPEENTCYDCEICAYHDYSESSAFPVSEEEFECLPTCDEVDSLPSDGEHVVSSSDSQQTTSSKVAKKIKTVEASESIKSKNRPTVYSRHDIRTGQALSPRQRCSTVPVEREDSITSNVSTTSITSNASTATNDTLPRRVQGRREQNMRRRSSQISNTSIYSHISTDPIMQSDHSQYKNPVMDIDAEIERANMAQTRYSFNAPPGSPPTDFVPFLNPVYDNKKKKKKFLSFGKR